LECTYLIILIEKLTPTNKLIKREKKKEEEEEKEVKHGGCVANLNHNRVTVKLHA
jgi:hypothetical protein